MPSQLLLTQLLLLFANALEPFDNWWRLVAPMLSSNQPPAPVALSALLPSVPVHDPRYFCGRGIAAALESEHATAAPQLAACLLLAPAGE